MSLHKKCDRETLLQYTPPPMAADNEEKEERRSSRISTRNRESWVSINTFKSSLSSQYNGTCFDCIVTSIF